MGPGNKKIRMNPPPQPPRLPSRSPLLVLTCYVRLRNGRPLAPAPHPSVPVGNVVPPPRCVCSSRGCEQAAVHMEPDCQSAPECPPHPQNKTPLKRTCKRLREPGNNLHMLSLHTHICTRLYTDRHTQTHIHTYAGTQVDTHTHTCTYMYTHKQNMHTHTYTHTNVDLYTHAHICTHVDTHMQAHTHRHT